MAFWEHPEMLSGTPPQQVMGPTGKPEMGLVVIHTGEVRIEWANRFRMLQFPNYTYAFNSNQPYDTSREQATRGLLEHGVKYIFMLDTDVLPPINAVPVMIEWMEKINLPVLSGLYWAKKPEIMPAAWINITGKSDQFAFAPLDVAKYADKQTIVPVDVCGAGCLLVRRDVFEKLDKSDPEKPYFLWGLGRKGLPQISEDFYFCMRCVNELKIKPHVALPVKCGHIATCTRRSEDGQFELIKMI